MCAVQQNSLGRRLQPQRQVQTAPRRDALDGWRAMSLVTWSTKVGAHERDLNGLVASDLMDMAQAAGLIDEQTES